MRFTNSFLASTTELSRQCTNPERVFEAMKRTMRQSMHLQHARYVFDLFTCLQRKHIGTTNVMTLSNRICNKLPKRRSATLTGIIIKWKVTDAVNEMRKAKYENTMTWREIRPVLVAEYILNQYEQIWREEKQIYGRQLRDIKKKKIDHLKAKFKATTTLPDTVREITVADQEIPDNFSTDPRVYGGCTLTADEEELLKLPPKFSVYDKVNAIECEIQVEKGITKYRWATQAKKREAEQLSRGETPNEDERQPIYDSSSKVFDFRHMRGTDLPFNKRITLPGPTDEETEITLHALKSRLNKRTREYVQNNTNDTASNMTSQQKRGLKSIIGKINNKEMVIFVTDKSDRNSVDNPENYRQTGDPHIQGDESITRKEYGEIEKNMNAHSVAWIRMLNAGVLENDQKRIKDNMITTDSAIPPLYTSRKDHKAHGDMDLGPPTRPVCGITSSANKRISHLLSIVLSEIWKRDEESVCMSTEEMVSEIDRLNIIVSTKRIVVGSTDVKALYPSLDIPFTVSKVCETIDESGVVFEGLWYKEIGLYLSINCTNEELIVLGLRDVCPTRATNRGAQPSIKAMREPKETKRFEKWNDPAREPTDNEKRAMIMQSIRIILEYIMNNHVYTFANEIKRQKKGGPIGLDITGAIAQVFMIWWDRAFKSKLVAIGIELLMLKRYVDDINTALLPVEPGTRYRNDEIHIEEDQIEHDRELGEDKRTMLLLQSIGNTIHPSIQLEIDFPSNHDDGKMPILDLKMWVEERGEGCRVMHEHYQKDVSSKSVVHAQSALPWSMKRTVLTQEVLRVLLNCSRDLPWIITAGHVSTMMARIQFSGYDHQFRYEVLNSALKAYDKLREAEVKGERPLYRPKNWEAPEREKERRKKKRNWYKRGGYESVIFVPATPKSTLRKEYEEEVKNSGLKVRIVEQAGTSIKRKMQRSNPFKEQTCHHDECLVCSTGGKGPCDALGVTYEVKCTECTEQNNDDKEQKYTGETARSAYTRGKEHLEDLDNKRETSKLWQHCRTRHDGKITDFSMSVTGMYKDDAMLRQIAEAVRINGSTATALMNNKTEWNYVNIPRMVIEQ